MEKLSDNLLTRLLTADVCCKDCGTKYGKYSVGVSSTWNGVCGVCGESKPITEVRDWGYLTKGIRELKENIKEQSAEVAKHMQEVENEKASYEEGDIVCKFTKDEITALVQVIDDHRDNYPGEAYESAFEKIDDLYQDYYVEYSLSPALKAYMETYGTTGYDSPEDEARWNGFVTAYNLLNNND